jgi:hypothetical protein
MKRITLTLDLIRRLLQQTVSKGSRNWIKECFALMDKAEVVGIRKWKREDLYRV